MQTFWRKIMFTELLRFYSDDIYLEMYFLHRILIIFYMVLGVPFNSLFAPEKRLRSTALYYFLRTYRLYNFLECFSGFESISGFIKIICQKIGSRMLSLRKSPSILRILWTLNCSRSFPFDTQCPLPQPTFSYSMIHQYWKNAPVDLI